MSIRFCEFCSTVHRDGATHCPDCGAPLAQDVSEEYFNDPGNPWPFVPISYLRVQIQGTSRSIRFEGTHSVFHLWSVLHSAYRQNALYFHERGEEMELAWYPDGQQPEDYRLLDPVAIMASKHHAFSLYAYQEGDHDAIIDRNTPAMMYHGSFEIEDCPEKYWRDILGFMVATEPRPELENNWTYVIS